MDGGGSPNGNEEYALKLTALSQQIAALGGNDYETRLQQLQDKQQQLVQVHANEIAAIKDKAEIERNQRILSTAQRFNDEIASCLTKVLMRHQTFGARITNERIAASAKR